MQRLKRILKWSGIVLGGLMAILLVANGLFVWITDARLERQLAAIREAGDPVTLADLARPPIPPEENAATYLQQAETDVEAIHKDLKPYFAWREKHEGCPMPPEIQMNVDAAFDRHPNVFPLLEQAAACPDYNANLDYTLPSRDFLNQTKEFVSRHRSVTQVLRCRAELLTADGHCDEAVKTTLVTFRLARHFDRDPLIVGYLVALVVRRIAVQCTSDALQKSQVSKDLREALDAELTFHERMDGFRWIIKSERAFVRKSFIDTMPGRNFWFFGRGFWNLQESECLKAFPPLIDAAGSPNSYRRAEQVIAVPTTTVTTLLFPGFQSTFAAATKTQAAIRCLRVLNAIQTHVPADGNEMPKLSELGLPAETTIDPFNGEPLHIKKLPEGWLVYSVGRNLQDDGGKLDNADSDVGIGPFRPSVQPAEENGKPTDKLQNGV